MASKRSGEGGGGKKGRLSLRLRDDTFVRDVHAFAERNHTSVTALVEAYLAQLLESERNIIKVEQG
jgi:hypothetical protein